MINIGFNFDYKDKVIFKDILNIKILGLVFLGIYYINNKEDQYFELGLILFGFYVEINNIKNKE